MASLYSDRVHAEVERMMVGRLVKFKDATRKVLCATIVSEGRAAVLTVEIPGRKPATVIISLE